MTRPITTQLIIRPAQEADIAAIAAIYADAVARLTSTFDLDAPAEDAFSRQFETLAAGGFPWLVAVRRSAIAGYAYASPARARLGWRWTVEHSIYVADGHRGAGVGTALLAALIAEAETRGFRQMIAAIGDSQNHASIALHRRAGFTEVGTFRAVGRKHDRWLDVVLMQRALGEGDSVPPADETSSSDF